MLWKLTVDILSVIDTFETMTKSAYDTREDVLVFNPTKENLMCLSSAA